MKIIEHFVGGNKYSGNSKRSSIVYDPSTGEETAKVKLGSQEDINKTAEELKKKNVRILGDGIPKNGAHNKPVLFLHPKDFFGTLIELEQE